MASGMVKDRELSQRISDRLRTLRESLGVSQREMGRRLGISGIAWSYYENRKCDPGIAVMVRIADHFSLTLDELVGRQFPRGGK